MLVVAHSTQGVVMYDLDVSTQAPELDADLMEHADLGELEQRLQNRLGGRIRHLRLLLSDSGIVLRGLARTYYAKQVAQTVVMMETTVPILANEIEVV